MLSSKKQRSTGLRWAAAALLLLTVLAPAAEGRKKPEPVQYGSIRVIVQRASDGKPIQNAAVILHPLRPNGAEEADGFELKTDSDGHASMEDLPYGKLRLQVVAERLQTYGEDVEISEPSQEFVVRLDPPARQVSGER